MAQGILVVEAFPASPEQAADFHAWYEGTHLKEMVALDGVVSAQPVGLRLSPPPSVRYLRLVAETA